MGYNADLYENFTAASASPAGLVAVSVLIEVSFKKQK